MHLKEQREPASSEERMMNGSRRFRTLVGVAVLGLIVSNGMLDFKFDPCC
jgi:hypothetical protein